VLVAIASLRDFSTWARSRGLEIVLLVTGAALFARFVRWLGRRITEGIDDRAGAGDALVRSEEAKHRHALAQVVTWTVLVFLYIITGLLVFQRLGVPLPSLVAPAAVAGVALGFGAQRIVQDLLAGFFIIAERQYGFGDVIRISTLGATTGVTGTVEDVNLRITRIRTINGEVVMVPNGQLEQVTNLSRDWARAVVDVPVPTSADINQVTAVLRDACNQFFADEDVRPLLLDPPSVMGVESLEAGKLTVRVVARTLPGKQFEVARLLRARVATALQKEGIAVSFAFETTTLKAMG
jgi:small conductance mechanosensitive channel